MNIIVLDGKMMTEKKVTHEYIAEKLAFPSYYGNNLDALADCLSEIKKDIVIVISNKENIIENLDNYGSILLTVFEEILDKKQLIIL